MSTPIRFLEHPPLRAASESAHYDGTVDFDQLRVGDLCFYHHQGAPCQDPLVLAKLYLTTYYFQHNVHRPPLILAMPDAASSRPRYFLVDGQCYSNKCARCGLRYYDKCQCPGERVPRGYYDGWAVTGVPPSITVQPSVDFDDEGVKHYHGFVQNGVIGDG